jgi:hypothetical protein
MGNDLLVISFVQEDLGKFTAKVAPVGCMLEGFTEINIILFIKKAKPGEKVMLHSVKKPDFRRIYLL